MTKENTATNATKISEALSVADIYLTGRLGADPVVKTVETKKGDQRLVANVNLAAKKLGRKDDEGNYPDAVTFWVRVSAWEGVAEKLEEFGTGDLVRVRVQGLPKKGEWTNDDGEKFEYIEVTAAWIEVPGKGGNSAESRAAADLDNEFDADIEDDEPAEETPKPRRASRKPKSAEVEEAAEDDEPAEETPRRSRRRRSTSAA